MGLKELAFSELVKKRKGKKKKDYLFFWYECLFF